MLVVTVVGHGMAASRSGSQCAVHVHRQAPSPLSHSHLLPVGSLERAVILSAIDSRPVSMTPYLIFQFDFFRTGLDSHAEPSSLPRVL